MKFAHSPLYDVARGGRVKVSCACGKQSQRMGSWDEAREAYEAHLALVGITEKQRLK